MLSPFNDMTQSLPSWQTNKLYCYLPAKVKSEKFLSNSRSNLAVSHDRDLCNPAASPIFSHSTETRICPTLIVVGDAERVRDDGIYFATQSMNELEPILVQVFQDCAHVFQLFCHFDSFSNHSLEKIGVFIKQHTGPHRRETFLKSAVMIYNRDGYPNELIPDLAGILTDGVELLLQSKIWKKNAEGIVTLNTQTPIRRSSL